MSTFSFLLKEFDNINPESFWTIEELKNQQSFYKRLKENIWKIDDILLFPSDIDKKPVYRIKSAILLKQTMQSWRYYTCFRKVILESEYEKEMYKSFFYYILEK